MGGGFFGFFGFFKEREKRREERREGVLGRERGGGLCFYWDVVGMLFILPPSSFFFGR